MSKELRTILIVDDCLEDRMAYRRYLKQDCRWQYQISEVESAQEALELYAETTWDVILLDYLLPDLNGLELLQELKARYGKTLPPILILTGEGNEEIAAQAIKNGAADYAIKKNLTVNILCRTIDNAVAQIHLQKQLEKSQQQQQLLATTALQIRQSLNLGDILNKTVTQVRQLLECDRALIYQFHPDMSGTIVAESVGKNWQNSLESKIVDTCFQSRGATEYSQGRMQVIANIYEAGLSDCHLKLLEEFEVKANLVVPIVCVNREHQQECNPLWDLFACHQCDRQQQCDCLWGLLICHQCDRPRQWQESEINLLEGLATQISLAIQQAELYKTLNLRVQELARSNNDLEQFAYVASHDLREPLRKIKSYIELLVEDYRGKLDPNADKYINYIASGAERMQALISDLLSYSRVGKGELVLVATDLDRVLEQVTSDLSLSIQENNATIVIENLPTVKAHPQLLHQVFQNLIANSLKFRTQADPIIKIRAQQENGQWLISVSDNGIGIQPQYQERIFVIFQRLHGREKYPGTGLGLAICQKIIQRHGGRIWVESELGKGSTFYFTLKAVN